MGAMSKEAKEWWKDLGKELEEDIACKNDIFNMSV